MATHITEAFICDAIRTPIGRYGGALSAVRTDDLGAIPIKALMQRNAKVDWAAIADVLYGCANQAGESKIVPVCSYPLTGVGCVSRIYTDLATIDITPQGLRVIDMVEGLDLAELQRLSGVPLALA